MSEAELPPWVREQLARYAQLQQTLQTLQLQRQQLESELSELERALAQLKELGDSDQVFKAVGPLLIKSNKEALTKELEERKELTNARAIILSKQEAKVRESLKELEAKIQEALKAPPPS
ncbi:MAG: prefoldin subunit beta [Nitrososphaerota archaeon]